MGMYTEFYANFNLKRDTPTEVTDILEYLVNRGEEPPSLPGHPLFECPRWECLGAGPMSFMFTDSRVAQLTNGSLILLSNLKDYNGETDKFFDWIMPWIDADEGEFIGYTRYEDWLAELEPVMLYHKR